MEDIDGFTSTEELDTRKVFTTARRNGKTRLGFAYMLKQYKQLQKQAHNGTRTKRRKTKATI